MQDLLPFTHRALITARPKHRAFVDTLRSKHTDALCFLPNAALDWYLENERVLLALENGEPCGYVLGRDKFKWNIACRPITQAAICFDAQRRHHGLALVAAVAEAAMQSGQVAVQCCCAEDLDANAFWKIAGFEEICRLTPKNVREREVICWRLQLTTYRPAWFDVPPPISGYRASRTQTRR